MKKMLCFLFILAADTLSLVGSFFAAYFIRVKLFHYLFTVENPWFFPISHFYGMYYLLVVFIIIFFYERLYTQRYEFFEELVYITRGLFLSVMLIGVIIYLSRSYETFSRTIPILMMFCGMILVPFMRFVVKKLLMATGLYLKNTAVIGTATGTTTVMPALKNLEPRGYHLAEVITLADDLNLEKIAERIADKHIETLVIVSAGLSTQRLNDLINDFENNVEEIKIVSDASYLKTVGVKTEYIDELLVMRMENKLLSPLGRLFKRVFDLAISMGVLVLMLPVFLIIMLIIKLESRGAVFFVQERYGRNGKRFKFLKFRTMYNDNDEILKKYLEKNPQYEQEWATYKKLKTYDPRVTWVGRFLRRFSLDEMPQMINVLLGDMSLVGPRPYLPREKEEIAQSAAIIFRVKSGLTGLWQIKGRNELDFATRLKLDEFYVRNWSFFQDIVIILKTFGVVLRGKGAY